MQMNSNVQEARKDSQKKFDINKSLQFQEKCRIRKDFED